MKINTAILQYFKLTYVSLSVRQGIYPRLFINISTLLAEKVFQKVSERFTPAKWFSNTVENLLYVSIKSSTTKLLIFHTLLTGAYCKR